MTTAAPHSPKAALVEATARNGYPRYSADEMARRDRRLQKMAEAAEASVVIVCGAGYLDSPIQYVSNWASRTPSFALLWPDGGKEMYVRLWNHVPNARDISVIDDVHYGGDTHREMVERLAERLKKAGAVDSRIGLIGAWSHWDVEYLVDRVGCRPVRLDEEFTALRRTKSDEELVFVRAASEMGDRALEALRATVQPGMLEYELERVVQDAYLGTRAQPVINFFLSTPMRRPDRCVPRQFLSDRRIEPGDVLVTEISAWYWGYTGQILRTLTVGEPPDDRYARLHDVALQTYERLRDLCVPGTAVSQLLDAADAVNDAGLTIWDDLLHGYGGGGYLSPVLRTNQTGGADVDRGTRLEDGWVLIVQPNVVTHDSRAGVQVGNGLVVREGAPEVLQEYPTELIVCV